jgi:hypothetical protein
VIGPYLERGVGPQGLAGAGLSVTAPALLARRFFMNETILKIGRYGRPIFWAGLMSLTFYALIKIFLNSINPSSEVFFFSQSFGSMVFSVIMDLILISIFAASVYRVTHPYKSTGEHDSHDQTWATGIVILVPIFSLHLLVQYFFGFDLLGTIFSSDYENLMI